ncbi:MAG: hypothetical protein KFF73_17705 [Cyclobacteriaceae bacterium]|nr:hypothetical protein [Cyclobacteriaceae bacterium]
MKMLAEFVVMVLFIGCFHAKAQYNSGDEDLNKSLVNIDADASINFGAFRADLSGRYNVSDNKIDYLSVNIGMTAGDIYMTLELAKITGKPVDQVVVVYQNNRGKGWGVIAKEMGIKPGSQEFHALKGNAKTKGNKASQENNGKGNGKK